MTNQANRLKLPILSFVSVACLGLDLEWLKKRTQNEPIYVAQSPSAVI